MDVLRRQLAESRAPLDSEHRSSERQGDGDVARHARPSSQTVVANGKLVQHAHRCATRAAPSARRRCGARSRRIPVYLMVIAAAPLERFDLGDTACGLAEGQRCVPQSVYTAPEQRGMLPGPFARAGEIVQLFARLVGPFPYEKLAHLQSSTRFGGMENASEIFYSDGAFRRRTMNDGLDRARDGASMVRRRGDRARVGAPVAVRGIRDVFRRALDARRARRQRVSRADGRHSAHGARRHDVGDEAPGDRHDRDELSRAAQSQQLREGRVRAAHAARAGRRARVLRRAARATTRSIDTPRRSPTTCAPRWSASRSRSSAGSSTSGCERPGYPEVDGDVVVRRRDARGRRSTVAAGIRFGAVSVSAHDRRRSTRRRDAPRDDRDVAATDAAAARLRVPLASAPARVVLDPDVELLAALTSSAKP